MSNSTLICLSNFLRSPFELASPHEPGIGEVLLNEFSVLDLVVAVGEQRSRFCPTSQSQASITEFNTILYGIPALGAVLLQIIPFTPCGPVWRILVDSVCQCIKAQRWIQLTPSVPPLLQHPHKLNPSLYLYHPPSLPAHVSTYSVSLAFLRPKVKAYTYSQRRHSIPRMWSASRVHS